MDLSALALNGSVQIHIAPTLLVIDERAHQIFQGFDPVIVYNAVRFRYSSDCPVSIGSLEAKRMIRLDELSQQSDTECIVIQATNLLHPGGVGGLIWVVDRLLGPGGCPWDREQTHDSLKRHLIEECYELLQAIDNRNDAMMIEELGDVLLQPIMHAQMEALRDHWDIDVVAKSVTEKLIRRHPHVFGDKDIENSEEVLKNWDEIKKKEKGNKNQSILAGVPNAMPALLRAFEVSKRAARSGFEWQNLEDVWEKLLEEEAELRSAIESKNELEISNELGDLLFTVVNLARWMKVEPEDALRKMVDRFVQRFQYMESESSQPLSELSAEQWDELWRHAKSVSD